MQLESIMWCNFFMIYNTKASGGGGALATPLYQNKLSLDTHSETCEYFISILCQNLCFATFYNNKNNPPLSVKSETKNPKDMFP